MIFVSIDSNAEDAVVLPETRELNAVVIEEYAEPRGLDQSYFVFSTIFKNISLSFSP